jgi:membrane protease YdiL (CAAX protease family)
MANKEPNEALSNVENQIVSFIKHHPLSTFFILTIIYSWIIWGSLLFIAPEGFEGGRAQGFSEGIIALIAFVGGTGSSVMGIILTHIVDGKEDLRLLFSKLGRWQVNFAWYSIAFLISPLLFTILLLSLAFLVSPVFLPGVVISQDLVSLVGFGIVLGLVAGIVEEFGWTGFALPRLQSKYSTFSSGLILGVVWGIWHFMGDYWGRRVAFGALQIPNFIVFVIMVAAYRILMTWIYNKSNGSLFLAILMHASFSGSQFILIPGFSSVIDHITAHSVFAVAFWLIVAVVVIKTGKNWEKIIPTKGI